MNVPRSVRITGWGAYAPETVLTNDDLAQIVDTSDEWITSRTGIRERRVAGPLESTATMGAIAAKRAVAVAGLAPDDVDLIILATLTPDHITPATGVLVKEALGNSRAPAFDLGAACSGFVYAYATAHAYVASGMARHALVIGSELLTRYLDFTDRNTCVLFGDGAGAVVLSASEEEGGGLGGLELTADPEGAWSIWIPAGGARRPTTIATLAGSEQYLRMDGRETYRFATRTIASSALKAVERAGWTADEVDLIVPHQANLRIIESVAKGLGIPMDRFFIDLDRYGNTSAASVPIALSEAVDAGRLRPGDKVLFVAFGAGFTSGAAAVTWTADPATARRADAVPPVAQIHPPVDWDAGDPVPERLAAVLAAKQRLEVPA
jgi:3-oxoacyl-[acyl-carrier-protein] synthase III